MNVRQLQAFRHRQAHVPENAPSSHPTAMRHDPRSVRARSVSRRRFMQTSAGVVVAGATVGRQIFRPDGILAAGADPLPIPGGSPNLGGAFHIYGPTPDGSFDPIDAEPSTITNFNGVVGLAYIDGTVTRTRISTGETTELPFLFSDMRFMQGVYRGEDGRPRQGAFALI
jgi:hypothetical protein